MDSSELATYEFQLSQVVEALAADPDNTELKTLQAELENLIALSRELAAGPSGSSPKPAAAAPAAPAPAAAATQTQSPRAAEGVKKEARRYAAGEEVLAKYQADGRWYPARVTSVGGSAANAVYSIVFKGYNTTEQVSGSALRPARPDAASGSGGGAASTSASTSTAGLKRGQPLLTPEEEAERERKRKRNEKKTERSESKNAAAKEKASSWQKFAKKGAKKGYGIAGAEGKSMFKTPDDPLARVGVVGAGKGMQKTEARKRHVYDEE